MTRSCCSPGRSAVRREDHRWWGSRKMGHLLQVLNSRGAVGLGSQVRAQLDWDLAERWYPETEKIPWREAQRVFDEKRFRSLGVRLERGRLLAHPDAEDGPAGKRATFLSPFDRLVHARKHADGRWGLHLR